VDQLEGKVAVVTGGTSGIGLATARAMAAHGAQVFLTGRTQARVDDAVRRIGPRVTGVRGDITKQGDLDTLAEVVRAHGRGLDVIFANAGGGEFAALGDITPEHLTDAFTRNVAGTVFTVQTLLPLLNPGASIILSSSTTAYNGTPSFSTYAASKAAVRSFGRTWAAELVDRGIRVNTLVPGPVATPGLTELAPADQQQALLDAQAADVPMGRIGRPDEIAAAVVFLASDASTYMTGTELFVDGGAEQL
jgi:NAD(P)-dependent dehydrogenase (short-subunit alcohol dehydrogenase family)